MAFKENIKRLNNILRNCTLCPHKCRVDRTSGKRGFCGAGPEMVVSTVMPHQGEEPPISGYGGSGTIFFSYCNMRCCYCQNYQISQEHEGHATSAEGLAEKMISLQGHGVHNINLVSPTIWLPGIMETLHRAKRSGLDLPIVYNTGGYDHPAVIKMLDGVVDIYMPDMRYSDDEMAERYSGVKDYVKYNRESVREMFRQVGELKMGKNGVALKGLLVRLLVMPENISGIKKTLDFLEKLSDKIYLSIMAQYHPVYHSHQYPGLSRRITLEEYQDVLGYARKLGFRSGWTQDHEGLDPENDDFIPDFEDDDVFRYYKE